MEYEWDENKRQSNLEKHGLDFVIAYKIYESLEKLTISSNYASEHPIRRYDEESPEITENMFFNCQRA
ncbi:MAG: hypothetical protein ABFS56_02795 [Pseudomonadota bacterium]